MPRLKNLALHDLIALSQTFPPKFSRGDAIDQSEKNRPTNHRTPPGKGPNPIELTLTSRNFNRSFNYTMLLPSYQSLISTFCT